MIHSSLQDDYKGVTAATPLSLQNITCQIFLFGHFLQAFVHISRVYDDFAAWAVERHIFQQFFQHRVQTACANVFGFFIHLEGNLRQTLHTFIGKHQPPFIGGQQSLVLLGQAGIGTREDLFEIINRQIV